MDYNHKIHNKYKDVEDVTYIKGSPMLQWTGIIQKYVKDPLETDYWRGMVEMREGRRTKVKID